LSHSVVWCSVSESRLESGSLLGIEVARCAGRGDAYRDKYPGAMQPALAQTGQRFVGLGQGKCLNLRTHRYLGRQDQELRPMLARQGRRALPAMTKER
jgi:hypothetical protein